jgi:multidrug resistance efflux pump
MKFSAIFSAVFATSCAIALSIANPLQAQSSSCDNYIKQANESVFQTEAAVNVSKSQLKEAETKAGAFQALVKEGAISQTQLDKALKQVQDAKKELEQATNKQKEAQQQLVTLKGLNSCEGIKFK